MSLRPCSQVISASGSDNSTLSAALETVRRRALAPAPLSDTCVVPGARKSSRWTVQDFASLCSSAAMSCSGRPPSMICSELNSICAGIGSMRDACHHRPQRRQHAHRLGGIVLGDKLVGIELPRRQRRAQQRRRAEADVADAGKFQRTILGAVARLDLFEPRAGLIGLDLGRDPPRRCGTSARRLDRRAASVTAPSKRGARASKASTPSRSAANARSPGSMLR